MDHETYSDDYIRGILQDCKSIAVVGASAKPVRPSFFVVKYLISKGYDVIPINPGLAGGEICGAKVYASLRDIDRPIDMVDIFRNSAAAFGVVEDVLALDPLPKAVWMQLTIFNQDAATMAEDAGLRVVMNRCPKIEYARLSREIGWVGVASNVISSKRPVLQKGYQRFGIVQD
ncbi:MAG: CoA-binding protein [Pseudomonadota bacterium]